MQKKNLSEFLKELGAVIEELIGGSHKFLNNTSAKQEKKIKNSEKPQNDKQWKFTPTLSKPKVLGAEFVSDVKIKKDSEIQQETVFEKIWKVKNTGDCNWPEGCHLKFIGGNDKLNIPLHSKFELSKLAKQGQSVDIAVELTAPKEPGTYNAYFSLVSPKNIMFGQKLLMEVKVIRNKDLEKWGEKLKFLAEMGFLDTKKLIVLLEKNKGDLPATIQDHLQG